MKVSIFFLSFLFSSITFQLLAGSTVRKSSESLRFALKNISDSVFESSQRQTVHIIRLVDDFEDRKQIIRSSIERNLINGLKEENIPYQIREFSGAASVKTFCRTPAILLSPSIERFELFLSKIGTSPDNTRFEGFGSSLYFYIGNATFDDIQKPEISGIYSLKGNDLYFLIEEEEYFKLFSFSQLSPDACWKYKFIEVNRFSKQLNKWLTGEFSTKRVNNLNGCNLRLDLDPSFDARGRAAKDALQLDGIVESQTYKLTRKIFQALSSNLNFTLKPFKELAVREDVKLLAIGFERSMLDGAHKHPISQPYLYQEVYVAVPVGEMISDFEKLVRPFDNTTWFLITLTFFFSLSTIFILNRSNESIRQFVIGQKVTAPSLNVLKIFFGLPLFRLPGRNFARYLTILFIMYSLIIRVSWQGKMFEYLQQDLRKPEMKSIDELRHNNFTFYLDFKSATSLRNTEFRPSPTVVYKNIEDILLKYSNKLNDPAFKGAVQCLNDVIKYQAIATNGTFLRRILKRRIYLRMVVFFFTQGKILEIFDEKIGQMLEAGIINHFDMEHTEYINPKRYEHLHPKGPKVLTLIHLRAGFVIWLVLVVVAILSFVGEWIARMNVFLAFHCLISAFYDVKLITTSAKFNRFIICLSRNQPIIIIEDLLEVER